MFGFIRRILGEPQKVEITINVPRIQVTIEQPQARPGTETASSTEHRSGTTDKQIERKFLTVPQVAEDEGVDEKELSNKFSNTQSAVGKFGQDEHKKAPEESLHE